MTAALLTHESISAFSVSHVVFTSLPSEPRDSWVSPETGVETAPPNFVWSELFWALSVVRRDSLPLALSD